MPTRGFPAPVYSTDAADPGGSAPHTQGTGLLSCSTPYGITATRTLIQLAVSLGVQGCSTPYGITATRTWTAAVFGSAWIVCSTPYGITATRTRPSQAGQVVVISLLNALRHHGDKDREGRIAAQRSRGRVLNALRHHGDKDSPANATCAVAWPSAQRLTASRRQGLVGPAGRQGARSVLNALRHHGDKDCGQPRSSRERSCAQPLTASRRQGPQ